MKMLLSVPGSLLMAGEYVILLEGGLGIAIAPDRRVYATATVNPRGIFTVNSRFGGSRSVWEDDGEDDDAGRKSGLIAATASWLKQYYSLKRLPPLSIDIDSDALFGPDGQKLGLGSSAAVVCLLMSVVSAAVEGELPEPETLFLRAVATHRAAQGGRGSGYDVAASLFGGIGQFSGGKVPRWDPIAAPEIGAVELKSGERPVSSSSAVDRYFEARIKAPELFEKFEDKNNRLVKAFAESAGFSAQMELLAKTKELGIEIGRHIGINADLSANPWWRKRGLSGFWKAAGAGDELAFKPLATDDIRHEGAVSVAAEGLRNE